jgi:hypothetical protein
MSAANWSNPPLIIDEFNTKPPSTQSFIIFPAEAFMHFRVQRTQRFHKLHDLCGE